MEPSGLVYGDLLIGNRESSLEYSETIEGTKWVFIGDYDDETYHYDDGDGIKIFVLALQDWEELNSTNRYYPFTDKYISTWEYIVEPKYFYSPNSALQLSNQHLAKHVLEKYDS
jgi:hypothetical protein